MPELAYPVGHPAHPDYKGEPWSNPAAKFDQDFPVGHPARLGANVREIDTPDGRHKAHLEHTTSLRDLAAMGSLPPVVDSATGEKLELTADQLAHVYAVRNGLQPPLAAEVTSRYGLTAQQASASEPAVPQPSAHELAKAHIMGLGYTPERAEEIIAEYGLPKIAADKLADERR